jgi:hypothetical protein
MKMFDVGPYAVFLKKKLKNDEKSFEVF